MFLLLTMNKKMPAGKGQLFRYCHILTHVGSFFADMNMFEVDFFCFNSNFSTIDIICAAKF